jgi:hypothetical protein
LADEVPAVSWAFIRGALLGCVLGALMWAGLILVLVKVFGR